MLIRTQRRIIFLFIIAIICFSGYGIYYNYSQPVLVSKDNIFLENAFVYRSKVDDNALIIMIPWYKAVSKKNAGDINNFSVDQVIPSDRDWIIPENHKNCRVIEAQYAYAPWVDTEEKRKKADPDKREQKITQLKIKLDAKVTEGDYFRITAKNIETTDKKLKVDDEKIVIQITGFNFMKL